MRSTMLKQMRDYPRFESAWILFDVARKPVFGDDERSYKNDALL
ncbi:MAG: hypothetical protein ACLTKE_03975 [Coprococcus sp.]